MEDAVIGSGRARPTALESAAVGLAVAFAALCALVVGGRLTTIDHYALEHWMPGLDPSAATHSLPSVTSLFVPFHLGTTWWEKALDVATYPASVLVSFLVFVAVGVALVRRGFRVTALVWAALWVGANAVEVMLKVALEKPALSLEEDGMAYHLVPFDHSFPSGHAMRAVLVAGAIALVWRQLAWPAAFWALLVPVLLVVKSAHVPSDAAGGLIFGLLAVLAAHAVLPTVRTRLQRAEPGERRR
jgi:membrane-associated phospholipid phosphatase